MRRLLFLCLIMCLIIALLPSYVFAQAQNVKEVEERLLNKAAENIEKYRKGDAVIRFVSASGEPVRNAEVEVKQTRHDFLFGGELMKYYR